MALSIAQVSFEHHRTALGIGEPEPRISWRFDGTVSNWFQGAYELEIKRPAEGNANAHTFHVNSSDSVLVPWPADPLASGEEATVRVRSFGHSHGNGHGNGPNTPWSDPVTVEAGLLSPEDWQDAAAIVSDRETEVNATHRPIYFRKDFAVDEEILAARLYITALGVYEARLNGERVGDRVLAPGWQSYQYRHEYNTYDVTEQLHAGENTIGVTVGPGWYSGRLSWESLRDIYGDSLGVLCLLSVTTSDGTKTYIRSDDTWQSSTGPIISSEIYDGETYDSMLELTGWDSPGYDASDWLGTHAVDFDKSVLASPDAPPVRRIEERKLENVFSSASGKTVLDFGQNLVGWLRIRVKGPKGSSIQFVHTEVMENGEVATRPLRTAKATDNITLSGEEQEWEPSFTFHGFRYVQVDGWPEETELNADSVTAIVVHSDMEQTGFFSCSDPLLNKLHDNILWSMRGNFLSLPTDCPQRDERLGWTGDIHAFSRTANFIYNTAGFLRGWLKDAYSEQLGNNYGPPAVIPNILGPNDASAIWGDAIIAVPWALFQTYGDKALLREQYPGAQVWIDKGIPRNEVGLWNRSSFQYGDWLDPLAPPEDAGAATTSKYLVADAYLIHSTELLANISSYLDLSDHAAKYAQDRADLTRAFQSAWISSNGTVANETQTGLTLPLYFDLFSSPAHYTSAVSRLQKIIAANENKVGTGFAGTHLLGHALSKYNATSTFYSMLTQQEVPGWLFQVVMNGTTTWERWDSMLPNGSVNPGSMTSFNHYSVGSVGSWMHENIGGLKPLEPGWRRFAVDVRLGGGLTRADVQFVTGYGAVESRWVIEGGNEGCEVFRLAVRVPPNSEAVVSLPGRGRGEGSVVVGSGVHLFERCLS
ncbi:bacterial alpha-L-rhamnosidase-domain-containing protein [Aspergillus lucknowensis]|uniref:alpha-L-rhamnosidase n=1 Tax=Aspergillus lucknowensis TaxID=176173 RepID=A0ABR4LQW2_9EURO